MHKGNKKATDKGIYICWSPNWNGPQTDSGTPRFGILTNPYPNRFGESQNRFGDCFFYVFFQSRTRSVKTHRKLRQSQRHGAPLLTKKLGNQGTPPSNQELGEQEKGRLLLTSQIEGVVHHETPPHFAHVSVSCASI